jgi:hypothetical protein
VETPILDFTAAMGRLTDPEAPEAVKAAADSGMELDASKYLNFRRPRRLP